MAEGATVTYLASKFWQQTRSSRAKGTKGRQCFLQRVLVKVTLFIGLFRESTTELFAGTASSNISQS